MCLKRTTRPGHSHFKRTTLQKSCKQCSGIRAHLHYEIRFTTNDKKNPRSAKLWTYHLVKVFVYLTDINDYEEFNSIYDQYFHTVISKILHAILKIEPNQCCVFSQYCHLAHWLPYPICLLVPKLKLAAWQCLWMRITLQVCDYLLSS